MYERASEGPLAADRAAVMDGLGVGFPVAPGLLELCLHDAGAVRGAALSKGRFG